MNRVALGTAQFGLDYGVANSTGRVPEREARLILDGARAAGIDTLDTAVAYGDSEQRLGALGLDGWRVITKVPAAPADCGDAASWLTRTVEASIRRLRVPRLAAVLLHRPGQLAEPGGDALYRGLEAVRAAGLVERIGVSIYDPGELDALEGRYQLDIVQAPFSIVDRRLAESGWLDRLAQANVEVYVRSVFLQGLLLMDDRSRPPYFAPWASLWLAWNEWLRTAGLRPIEACLRYVLSCPGVARAVVGVDSHAQLQEIVEAAEGPIGAVPAGLSLSDPDLVNPSRWSVP